MAAFFANDRGVCHPAHSRRGSRQSRPRVESCAARPGFLGRDARAGGCGRGYRPARLPPYLRQQGRGSLAVSPPDGVCRRSGRDPAPVDSCGAWPSATLRALSGEGIETLSDGLAHRPFQRGGLTWIPQQLWAPVEKPSGLWTICMHSNTATDAQVSELRTFLAKHAAQFTSVRRVLAELEPTELSPTERLYEAFALGRIQASRIRKRLARRREVPTA